MSNKNYYITSTDVLEMIQHKMERVQKTNKATPKNEMVIYYLKQAIRELNEQKVSPTTTEAPTKAKNRSPIMTATCSAEEYLDKEYTDLLKVANKAGYMDDELINAVKFFGAKPSKCSKNNR
jgi:hypothetical protein